MASKLGEMQKVGADRWPHVVEMARVVHHWELSRVALKDDVFHQLLVFCSVHSLVFRSILCSMCICMSQCVALALAHTAPFGGSCLFLGGGTVRPNSATRLGCVSRYKTPEMRKAGIKAMSWGGPNFP